MWCNYSEWIMYSIDNAFMYSVDNVYMYYVDVCVCVFTCIL